MAAMYRNGTGVARDDRRATLLVRQAAEAGNYSAIVDLADCYDKGIGVPQDRQQAAEWYRKALPMETGDYVGPAKKWLQEHP